MPDRHQPIHPEVWTSLVSPVLIFLTVCSERRKPILARPEIVNLLLAVWEKSYQWKIGRYVVMPDHIHLFCSPSCDAKFTLDKWISFWKSSAARCWPYPEQCPIWQRDYWDRKIRAEESYSEKWNYVMNNPVRHGFVKTADQWPFQGELNVLSW